MRVVVIVVVYITKLSFTFEPFVTIYRFRATQREQSEILLVLVLLSTSPNLLFLVTSMIL